MEVKTPGQFPWQPQSFVLGNLAIGNLRQNMLKRLGGENGVHAGFACQNAALTLAAEYTAQHGYLPPHSIMLATTSTGMRHFLGDWINAPLLGGNSHPFWGFVAAAAIQTGVKADELPEPGPMAGYVAGTIGTPDFGVLRTPEGHAPVMQPPDLLTPLWPWCCKLLRLPAPAQMGGEEPPLSETHWPIIIAIVTQQFIGMAKDTLDPRIAANLALEAAIITAKLDPDAYEAGKWAFKVDDGRLSVIRKKAAPNLN